VAADESRAAEIGRDILLSGGNATDAATAMYFALAVTLPSAAGLGASGACIVHDDKTKTAEAFVFPPIAAPGAIAGQSFAVPSSVRAITLMHIRHGQLRWEQAVAPAERLARFGVPVSRALSRDLQAGASLVGADREMRRIFAKATGGTVTEGDSWVQTDLAGTLGVIRQRGGGEFFQGALARNLSEQVSQMGGSLPLEALRNAVPKAGPPVSEGFGTFARQDLLDDGTDCADGTGVDQPFGLLDRRQIAIRGAVEELNFGSLADVSHRSGIFQRHGDGLLAQHMNARCSTLRREQTMGTGRGQNADDIGTALCQHRFAACKAGHAVALGDLPAPLKPGICYADHLHAVEHRVGIEVWLGNVAETYDPDRAFLD